eukprot:6620224-Alexandrium_andersonii.AAC.1
MSASLVGSEMCIRDSVTVTRSSWNVGNDICATLAHTASSMISTSDCPKSVSYTHLTLPTICSV